jgi:hypothetical protein
LGDKMDMYLATDAHPRSVAHIDASAGVRIGDVLPMYFDMSRVHFFEPGEVGPRLAKNGSISRYGAPC